jgi:predicted RNase H-like nuclease
MAKRATQTEPYRPVQASLVSQVLAGGAGVSSGAEQQADEAPAPARQPISVQPVVVQPPPASAQRWGPRQVAVEPEPEQELAFGKMERLVREKRVMLSAKEEERIEDLVRSLARELRTPLKLSHLLRAALALIVRSREELLAQGRERQVERPPNGDTAGIAAFERSLGILIDSALRLTRPPA